MKHAMLLILTLALVPGGLVQFTPPWLSHARKKNCKYKWFGNASRPILI